MADIGKIRIRVPSTIKKGDVVRVKSIVTHPMEIVERDKQGNPIEKNYNYIYMIIVSYNGKEIAQFEPTQSISQNPYFSFAFKPDKPGQLKITYLDTKGGKYEGAQEIKF